MTDSTYNGWRNRATWLIALHLSNDPAWDAEARGIAARAHDGWTVPDDMADHYTPERIANARIYAAAAAIRRHVTDALHDQLDRLDNPDGTSPLAATLLYDLADPRDVDWESIAEHFTPEEDPR